MPSSYTASARYTLQAAGENLNTWGLILNSGVFQLVDDNINGRTTFTLSGSKTLTTANGATDEARRAILDVTGGSGGTITIPSVSKLYMVRNASTGDVVLTTGAGRTATVVAGVIAQVVCDATNVDLAVSFKNVPTPVANTDAVNKAYSDAQLAAAKTYTDNTAFTANAGILPGQSGNAGKFLTTNGSVASWGSVDLTRKWIIRDSSTSSALAVDKSYGVNSTVNPIPLYLPTTSPADGSVILVQDIWGAAAINNITIIPGPGETMNGVANEPIAINQNYDGLYIVAVTGGWRTGVF